jgi:hypothetical protein
MLIVVVRIAAAMTWPPSGGTVSNGFDLPTLHRGVPMAMPMPKPRPSRPIPSPQRQPAEPARRSRPSSAQRAVPAPRPDTGAGGRSGGGGASSGTGGGGGPGAGEGRSLSALMDDLLGSDTGVPLTLAGPSSALVARTVGSPDTGQSFLAGVFWWLFTRSEAYRDVKRRLGASKRARPIVVSHADGTRFDLLFLDPRRRRRRNAIRLEGEQTQARFVSPVVPHERLNALLHRSKLDSFLESGTLLSSAQELAATSIFGVAIVNAPREVSTCAVSPAVPLKKRGNNAVATLGSFLAEAEKPVDTCLATTANHAVGRRWRTLTIDGVVLDVIRRHNQSDSCLARVNRAVLNGRQRNGFKGPLRRTPRTNCPAAFDGAASGITRTIVTSYDPAIIDPQPDEMCRVYTEADTAMGDSGAALIDEDDFILGFAWRRSRYDSPVQFSSWVWAEQVYMAHDLFNHMTWDV